jgi:CYTH domain-containing protein
MPVAQEIERKYLVEGDAWRHEATRSTTFRQGYLSTMKERTVRVRVAGDLAWLTIKGITVGASRSEFEYSIPVADGTAMLDELCERPLIEKTRHVVEHAGVTWEVDEFSGANEGLIVAEIELETADQDIDLPAWAGEEVTADPRYFNANLIARPFSTWGTAPRD